VWESDDVGCAAVAGVPLPAPEVVRARLDEHLRTWLGAWPPTSALDVVTSAARTQPGWDGTVQEVAGVRSPEGAVLSVPPDFVDAVAALGTDLKRVGRRLGDVMGRPGGRLFEGTFRWSESPTPLPDAGEWVPFDDPRVPEWLHPFGGDVLVAFEDGEYIAGVGVKRHDRFGHELAVVTEERAWGRGLARGLVCQAARRVIAQGAVPTYLHADSNVASAHVAEASGFPDRGWRIMGLGG